MKDKDLYVGIITKKVIDYPSCSQESYRDHYLIAFSEAEAISNCSAYIEARIRLDQSDLDPLDVTVVSKKTLTIVHTQNTNKNCTPSTTHIVYDYSYCHIDITQSQYNELFDSTEFEQFLAELKNLKPKNISTNVSPGVDNIVYVIRKPGQTDEEVQQAALFAKSGVYKLKENAKKAIVDEMESINDWLDTHRVYYREAILKKKDRLVELANSEIVAVKLTAEVLLGKNNEEK